MLRAYLETSFVSACVSTRSDLQSRYRREMSLLWWKAATTGWGKLISDEVIAELSDPRYPHSAAALTFLEGLPVISINEEMVDLAELFVARKVMPQPVRGDALHVAMATVARCDYLLTWNVKHLANPNKRQHLVTVCLEAGVVPPTIVRPDDLLDDSGLAL